MSTITALNFPQTPLIEIKELLSEIALAKTWGALLDNDFDAEVAMLLANSRAPLMLA